MRYVLVICALFATALSMPQGVRSQDATPTGLPVTPDPGECRVTPRSSEEARALIGTPAPAIRADEGETRPELLFPSQPNVAADESALAGIVETAREFVACLNADDSARGWALFTDEFLGRGGFDANDLASSDPRPVGEQIALLDVLYAREFPDGRVGAIVVLDDPRAPSPVESAFLLFVDVGDRWLIDDFPMYTYPEEEAIVAAEATPAAVAFGDFPDPSECLIAPRDREELLAMAGSPPAPPSRGESRPETPAPTPMVGRTADAATEASIVATVREWIACLNAGKPLRAFALFADGFWDQFSVDAENLDVASPVPQSEQSAFLGVFYVQEFPDGRVGAIAVFDTPQGPSAVEAYYFLFERVGDRWLFSNWPDTSTTEVSEGEVVVFAATPVMMMPETAP